MRPLLNPKQIRLVILMAMTTMFFVDDLEDFDKFQGDSTNRATSSDDSQFLVTLADYTLGTGAFIDCSLRSVQDSYYALGQHPQQDRRCQQSGGGRLWAILR